MFLLQEGEGGEKVAPARKSIEHISQRNQFGAVGDLRQLVGGVFFLKKKVKQWYEKSTQKKTNLQVNEVWAVVQ